MKLPVGKWVHFEVVAGLGEKSTGTWEVTVTLAGERGTRFEGLAAHPEWKTLTWMGWSSNATETTVFYLDNIELRAE